MKEPAARAALLDVNVLVALAWPNHVGHHVAQEWFHAHAAETGWATTPITEAGFVRVSSNRRALPTATTPGVAIELLRRMTSLAGHHFWPDMTRLVVGETVDASMLPGHRQVTDAHLVALCADHGGGLVTFDGAILELAGGTDVAVEVLRA